MFILNFTKRTLFTSKKITIEALFSLCYFFRQFFAIFSSSIREILGGNADVFYLGGVLAIYQNRKNLKKLKFCFYVASSFLLLALFQLILNRNLSILKLAINISKICLNIFLAYFIYDNCKKANIFKIAFFTTVLNGIFTILALLLRSSCMWTQNDPFNRYDSSRLRLFYLEPSELGFHVVVIIILLLGFFITTSNKKKKRLIVFLLLINAVLIALAKPLGSIGFGAAAILVLILYDWINHNSRQKSLIYILFFASSALVLLFMILTNNSIYLRVLDTFKGTDESNWYRINVAFSMMIQSLLNTHGLGIGFGNLRTQVVFDAYAYLGLHTSLANSFPSFITEGGIFALLFIVGLYSLLIRKCISSQSATKWALLTFSFVYQIFGGYFTSTVNWILYGFILSDFNEYSFDKQVCK